MLGAALEPALPPLMLDVDVLPPDPPTALEGVDEDGATLMPLLASVDVDGEAPVLLPEAFTRLLSIAFKRSLRLATSCFNCSTSATVAGAPLPDMDPLPDMPLAEPPARLPVVDVSLLAVDPGGVEGALEELGPGIVGDEVAGVLLEEVLVDGLEDAALDVSDGGALDDAVGLGVVLLDPLDVPESVDALLVAPAGAVVVVVVVVVVDEVSGAVLLVLAGGAEVFWTSISLLHPAADAPITTALAAINSFRVTIVSLLSGLRVDPTGAAAATTCDGLARARSS